MAEGGLNFGLGVLVPGTNGAGEARTAPPVFNAARYAERANPPSSSSHLQYSSHIHSQSLAGLGLVGAGRMGYGLGGPPSPTGKKGKQEVAMLGGMKLPDKKRTLSGSKTEEDTKSPPHPTHHSSLSTSSAFFSSIRRRSNPLQPANKIPNSAKTVQPSIPATARGGSTPPTSVLASEDRSNRRDEPTLTMFSASTNQIQTQISSMTQAQIQAQAQAQRQRRSHRRNVSAGAMITSVIDEVSSDGTVSNKLSATRDRAPQKSGLRESTTASEIRRGPLEGETKDPDLNGEPTRLSTSSERSAESMSRVVSPIEFSRISEESNTGFSFKAPAFVFPRSMNIRSPLLSSEDGRMEKMNEEPSQVGSHDEGTLNGLLPPIELCPPSPPEVPISRPSATALAKDPKAKLVKEISSSSSSSSSLADPDADATPLAVPRRRHHVQLSNGTVVPASALDPPGRQKLDDTPTGLSASVSAPLSMASAGSSRTLSPNASSVNKHHEIVVTGRTSPGISASLGRLAGSSTAERIDERSGMKGNGVARRNSLTGGTTSATLSTSGSMGGGLKIPARISMKQDALKRDLNAVREFSGSINGTFHIAISSL